jgi:hypothetical protein
MDKEQIIRDFMSSNAKKGWNNLRSKKTKQEISAIQTEKVKKRWSKYAESKEK